MDVVELARLQYALTTIYHFFFVPVSIGLVLFVALMETMYVVKKDEKYKKMAKFWGKLFLINFAVGVVTGILQEFQFGMNWSDYSRFVGDVFGAPLAIEALFAFFLESTFIGLWIFGWDRLSKKLHLACIWLVVVGTTLSAFWILTANSFMQEPVGFSVQNGRAEMNDFFALISNPQLMSEFPHTVFGAYLTGAFLVAGICAVKMLGKKDVHLFKVSFNIAIVIGLISSLGVAFSGHSQAKHLVQSQPMKMAAAEGIWETTPEKAPWAIISGIDTNGQSNSFEINMPIPGLLSYLSYGQFTGSVTGMKELQAQYEQQYGEGDYIPPVKTTFWSFRIMVASGGLLILLSLYGTYLALRRKVEQAPKWYWHAMKWAIALPFIANTSGWIMTEVGRQPWTVFGLMTTADSVSPNVSAGSVLFSIITFTAVYTLLGGVMAYLFVKEIKHGPGGEQEGLEQPHDPFEKEVAHVS
ncbi:cytochrome ubiquinol oxidase subunit I [Saccharibacillus alkalitolerans]|uniref:Cytochrome ubiquinol oxidase subunit I n=1 Tax=Saccharibacillus alkalitolerans TaxID=2705290 RepID=A0ABX0F9T1_9BACL|nr:cytochrome ubiquinol oxidase subunit I [Saccharibacillus alkalitolerans]NGZ76734.1 cytochrome ubiquinol oxidase subunit I [Saccharibacillus alkalitolerans]